MAKTTIITMNSIWKEEHCATRRIIFTYPMVAYTDMEESAKTEVMEIATNACEKYLNDNQSVLRDNDERLKRQHLLFTSGRAND